MNSPERNNFGHEAKEHELKNIEQAGEKRREELERERNNHEVVKDNHEQENALHEAIEQAKERKKEIEARETSPAERRGPATKFEKSASFAATMEEVRSQMSAPSRTFSKLIHNKTVEKVSDITGNTVARPNAILSGAVFAFLITLAVYLIAKNLGYPLSGFETIGAFILGWAIGLVYDFLKTMITGRSSS